jgi:hypothetical protein
MVEFVLLLYKFYEIFPHGKRGGGGSPLSVKAPDGSPGFMVNYVERLDIYTVYTFMYFIL